MSLVKINVPISSWLFVYILLILLIVSKHDQKYKFLAVFLDSAITFYFWKKLLHEFTLAFLAFLEPICKSIFPKISFNVKFAKVYSHKIPNIRSQIFM